MTEAPNGTTRRRIALVINSLGPGGAERVMTSILGTSSREEWDCHLILLDREQDHRVVPDFVKVHRLDCGYSLGASIRQLRTTLVDLKPDLVVSFLVRANVASILASRAIRAPCVISERSQLSTHLQNEHSGLKLWAATVAPRLTYPWADHIIAVSDGVRSDLIRSFGVNAARTATICNPYDIERINREAHAEPEFPLPSRFIVGAGRLVKRKGFDDLIEGYAASGMAIPLCILGEGPERARLSARVCELGLERKVRFLGYAVNPFAIVRRADMFISPSHCEGFPNAIAEAMALGVPVVSTDCPSGPAELLDEAESIGAGDVHAGRYGLLVPVARPDLLAKGMIQMSEPETRLRYSAAARRRIADFHIDKIADQYWTTFAKVLEERRNVTGQKRLRRARQSADAFPADEGHAGR